ncbi:MAG TPA: VanZ family protein [Chthoniobacter sp.]|nr:VanZ family protein [Chthoniobacter sp.]
MLSSRWFRIFCWVAVFLWAGTIFFLSSLSGNEVEKLNTLHWWDKALHFLAFAAGGGVVAFTLRRTRDWDWKKVVLITTIVVSAYGWSDEWHQQWTPGRSAKDVGDWTADTLGGAAGALLLVSIYAQRSNSHRPTPPAARGA